MIEDSLCSQPTDYTFALLMRSQRRMDSAVFAAKLNGLHAFYQREMEFCFDSVEKCSTFITHYVTHLYGDEITRIVLNVLGRGCAL